MTEPVRAREVERKFSIEPEGEIPDLAGAFDLGEPVTSSLQAVYFDTPSYAVSRARRTLRRREGGHDEGWHLKLPAGGAARTEVRLPLDASLSPFVVPAALRKELAEVVGLEPLVPVAELSTTRVETPLIHPNTAQRVGEIADDTVRARRLADGTALTWRELEAEIDAGDDASALLLDVVTERFSAAGVAVSTSPSKVSTVLGDAVAAASERELSGSSSLGEVVASYLATQVGVVQGREAELADPDSDAVHKSRVATRRLRSALAAFAACYDPRAKPKILRTRRLRGELAWYAGVLGGPRDAEVIRARVLADLDTLHEEEGVDAAAHQAIEAALERRHHDALETLTATLGTPRQVELVGALVRFLSHPAHTFAAAVPAAVAIPHVLSDAADVVRALYAESLTAPDGSTEQLHLLHETRKKAKRARYVTEAAVPALGEAAEESAKAWERVTESLGEVQDGVVAGMVLRELAEEIGENQAAAAVLQRLADDEVTRAVEARAAGDEAVVAALAMAERLTG